MSRRSGIRPLPSAPLEWDASSRETWNNLIQALENSSLFDKGRRFRPQFVVKGTVSVPVTFEVNTPEVTVATHMLAKLLLALQGSTFVDVRETM